MVAVNYLWNPLNDNIVREFDDAATVAEYTTEPEQFGNIISQRRDVEVGYFHFDGVGSTLALTNQLGIVTDTSAYTAFGETTEQSGPTVLPFKYIGRKGYYADEMVLGLLVRRRSCIPQYGLWTSTDPLVFGDVESVDKVGEPRASGRVGLGAGKLSLNQYWYAHNSPAGFIDPSGAQEEEEDQCVKYGIGPIVFWYGVHNRASCLDACKDRFDMCKWRGASLCIAVYIRIGGRWPHPVNPVTWREMVLIQCAITYRKACERDDDDCRGYCFSTFKK